MSLMTELKALAKKFRKAADTLDGLIEEEGTPEKADEIRHALKPPRVHWTQRPENRARVLKMAKHRAQMRKAG